MGLLKSEAPGLGEEDGEFLETEREKKKEEKSGTRQADSEHINRRNAQMNAGKLKIEEETREEATRVA